MHTRQGRNGHAGTHIEPGDAAIAHLRGLAPEAAVDHALQWVFSLPVLGLVLRCSANGAGHPFGGCFGPC